MADHSVGVRDKLHESEVSQSMMFCFPNASSGNSCFVVRFVLFYFAVPTSCCSYALTYKFLSRETSEAERVKILEYFLFSSSKEIS